MAGRPSKIEKFTEAMAKILDTDHPVGFAIIYTDKDLFEMANERLEPEDRVSDTTFDNWKAGKVKDDPFLDVFLGLYKRALREQTSNLHARLSEDPAGSWQRWAWILERKFDGWNLRSRSVDETPRPKELVFRVGTADER
jgi:hypothetical protein